MTARPVFGLLVVALLAAPPAPGAESVSVDDLFRLSGLERQLDSVAAVVIAGLSQQAGRLAPETVETLTRAAEPAYSASGAKTSPRGSLVSTIWTASLPSGLLRQMAPDRVSIRVSLW